MNYIIAAMALFGAFIAYAIFLFGASALDELWARVTGSLDDSYSSDDDLVP